MNLPAARPRGRNRVLLSLVLVPFLMILTFWAADSAVASPPSASGTASGLATNEGLYGSTPAPTPGAQESCGAATSSAIYHGTNAERDLRQANIDPTDVVSYPCKFPASVRGIRINPGSIQLVAGGALVRTIPLPSLSAVLTLPQIASLVDDPSWISQPAAGVYLLSAALIQEPTTRLMVSAPAVRVVRLEMNPGLSMSGVEARADFNGVTVTSWDPTTSTAIAKPLDGRPFILYETDSTLNLSNSTFSGLGSDTVASYGVSWRVAGANGLVDNCVFENNFFGVYTYQAANVIFEHSIFRNNTFYGLDPHTNSTKITILDNNVYGNGDHGIVFSRFVTASLVEGNYVHGNKVNGIMMDYQSNGNRILDNLVVGNGQGIVFSASSGNMAEGNTLRDNGVGIRMSHDGADDNVAEENTVSGGVLGAQLYGGASNDTLLNNSFTGASKTGIITDAPRSEIENNSVSGSPIGIEVDTVATLIGDRLNVSKTGVEVTPQGIASLDNVAVNSGTKPLTVEGEGFASVTNASYGLPVHVTSLTTLDDIGIALVAFAFLCEVINLTRGRVLRRVQVAYLGVSAPHAGVGSAVAFEGDAHRPVKRPHRWLLMPAATGDSYARPAPIAPPDSQAATKATRRFRPDIEGLRAIAVGFVVLNHANLGLRGGYVGVDVFFVISGFLITRQLVTEQERSGRISFARFYARRARRILPAATLVTVTTLLFAYRYVSPLHVASVAKDAISSALFAANWRFAAQATSYFHATDPASPFQHYWSLSVEEQFYVVWPVLMVLVAVVFGRRLGRTRTLVGLLVLIVGFSLAASIIETPRNPSYGYFATYTRAWELGLGALVAVTAPYLAKLRRTFAGILSWIGLVAIVAAASLYTSDSVYPGYLAILPVGGAALVIAGGCGARVGGGPEIFLGRRGFQFGGRISYSLYLWHWPILIILPDALGYSLTVWQRLVAMAAAVVISTLTYWIVEQPFRQRESLVRQPGRALGLGLLLISCSVAVALIIDSAVTSGGNLPYSPSVVTAALDQASTGQGPNGVASAVIEAARQTALPSDLVPNLAQAANDFPNLHGCEVESNATKPSLPCNEFGDVSVTKTIVLVGDSHAGQWADAVSTFASAEHYRLIVYTKEGCPIGDYPNFVYAGVKRVYSECNAWRAAVIARIVQIRPAAVIIGSEERSIAAAEPSGLNQSIAQMARSGARMIFLADTPKPIQSIGVPECLAVHRTSINDCSASVAAAGIEAPGRIAEIQGAQSAGAYVIDPTDWFCDSTSCPSVIQNTVVYKDSSHITDSYASLREPQLAAQLAQALSTKGA